MFERLDIARLISSRIYISNNPNGRYNLLHRKIADEIILRFGKNSPELVI